MNRPDITQPKNMLAIQGERVLVYSHEGDQLYLDFVLTLVRCIDIGRQEMRMVNQIGRAHV